MFFPGCSFVAVEEEEFSMCPTVLFMWIWKFRGYPEPFPVCGTSTSLGRGAGIGNALGWHSEQGIFYTCWSFLNQTWVWFVCQHFRKSRTFVHNQSVQNRIKSVSRQMGRITGSWRLEMTSKPLSVTFLDITSGWRCELILQLNYSEPGSCEERDLSPAAASAAEQLLLSWLLLWEWSSHSCRDSSRTWLWCLHSVPEVSVVFIIQEQIPCMPSAFLSRSSILPLFQYFCSQLSQLSLILPPAISPHPWNMGGHSDTEIQKIFHKGFCARSAPGFQKMTFQARIKMWIWCCKGALHSSPPQKRDVIPFLPHCSFLPSWCLLAQQPLPGVGGALDPKPVVTRVQCTNICVGSRPGAVSGAGTGQGGLGLVTHPPIAQRWIPEADRAVLTSSSPGALLLFLTSPSWVCHHEPWAGNKTKTDPVWDWAAAFIRVQTLITLKWSNVCQLLV